MKKLLLLFVVLPFVSGCDSDKTEYMRRHSKNYDIGHTITRGDLNPDLPGDAQKYDAEDYRAGALDVCNKMKQNYGRDLCNEINYWGILGPRIKPI